MRCDSDDGTRRTPRRWPPRSPSASTRAAASHGDLRVRSRRHHSHACTTRRCRGRPGRARSHVPAAGDGGRRAARAGTRRRRRLGPHGGVLSGGVICEVLDETGSMARLPQTCSSWRVGHSMKTITIKDHRVPDPEGELVRSRGEHAADDRLRRVHSHRTTRRRSIAAFNRAVMGEVSGDDPVLVRALRVPHRRRVTLAATGLRAQLNWRSR